jgi:hypothetical protein
VEPVETYGHFTPGSARSLTGKIGTRPLAISVDEDGRRYAVNAAWQGVVENTDTRPYYEMVSEALFEAWQRWGRDELHR